MNTPVPPKRARSSRLCRRVGDLPLQRPICLPLQSVNAIIQQTPMRSSLCKGASENPSAFNHLPPLEVLFFFLALPPTMRIDNQLDISAGIVGRQVDEQDEEGTSGDGFCSLFIFLFLASTPIVCCCIVVHGLVGMGNWELARGDHTAMQ